MPSLYEQTAAVGDVSSSDFTTLYNASGLTVPNAGAGAVTGNLNVSGNLTVQGTSNLIGAVTIGSTLSTPNYTFPLPDGSTDQVLATDGSGNLFWTNVTALPGTDYQIEAGTATGGANLTLFSSLTSDSVKFASGTNTTVVRTDANTITINAATYNIDASATTGGANLNLTSGATTDTVKFAGSAHITVAQTDANTITISTDADNIPDGTANGQLLVWENSAWTATPNIVWDTSTANRTLITGKIPNNLAGRSNSAIGLIQDTNTVPYTTGDGSGVYFAVDSDSQSTNAVNNITSGYQSGSAASQFKFNASSNNFAIATATSITGGNTLVFSSAHGFAAGNRVRYLTPSTNGLTQETVYAVLATGLTTTQCQLSLTVGGAAIALTNGTGLNLVFQQSENTSRLLVLDRATARFGASNLILRGNTTPLAGADAQFSVVRGSSGADAYMKWSEGNLRWEFNNSLFSAGNISIDGDTMTINVDNTATDSYYKFNNNGNAIFWEHTLAHIETTDPLVVQGSSTAVGDFIGYGNLALNVDNSPTNTVINFDGNNNKYLRWNYSLGQFEFSDIINVPSEVRINGTTPFLTFGTQAQGVNALYGVRGTSALDDPWFVGAGSTGVDSGYVMIASGDNAGVSGQASPIYARQYNGYASGGVPWYGGGGTVVNQLTLLDGDGNTVIPNNTTVGGDVAVNGGDITTTATTASLFNTNAATLNVGGAATTLNIGNSAGIVYVGGDLQVQGGDITTPVATGNLFNTTATTVNIGNAATTEVNLGNAGAGRVQIKSPTIVGANTTQAVFNTVATTVNAFGAATTISIGANTGTTTINNDLVADSVTVSGNLVAGKGLYAKGAMDATFTDGIVVDYTTGNGRISVGSADTLSFYNGGVANTFLGQFSTGGDFTITGDLQINGNTIRSSSATPAIELSGANAAIYGDLAVNGGDITTTQTTASVFNTTATTLNLAGAATAVNIGATTGTTTINNDLFVHPTSTAPALQLGSQANINAVQTTTTATTTTAITASTRNAMNGTVNIKDNVTGEFHVVNFTILRNNTTAMLTTYGELYTGSALANFTADVSGGAIRLLATPASTNSTTFNVVRTSIT